MKPETKPGYNGRRYYEPSNTTLAILGAVAVLLCILYAATLIKALQGPKTEYAEVPPVISSFLEDAFVEREELDNVADKYFRIVEVDFDSESTEVSEEDQFGVDTTNTFLERRPRIALDYLLGDVADQVHNYRVDVSLRGYVEVTLLDIADKPIYPRFAFFYKLDEDGTVVVDYSMARLQPYSRRHEEYSKTWNT